MTREIPPDGSSIAFEQSMKTVAAYYVEALSVGLGALVTYATGNVEWGALTYESLSNFFKITTGAPAGLPKVPVEPFINPPGAE